MKKAIIDNAPAAEHDPHSRADDWALRLGTASIGMDPARPTSAHPWGQWAPAFDVVAHAAIGISVPEDRYGFAGRQHSLWYCDAQQAGVYRWYETAFMVAAPIPRTTAVVPFAFEPCENAGKALGPGITEWQLARPFVAIDQGEELPFIERWLDWFGSAAQGRLRRSTSWPEVQAQGTYRRK